MTRTALSLAALALAAAAAWWGLGQLGLDLAHLSAEQVRGAVHRWGPLAPAAYLATFGQPIVPLPASVLCVAGGLIFGPWWGFVGALSGAAVRASGQFLLARHLGRAAVGRLLRGRAAALDRRIGERAFRTVLLIRVIPNVPFDVQNVALGVSQVGFGPFVGATVLGLAPAVFAFAYLGHALTDGRHVWKIGLAMILVSALAIGQRAWRARAPAPRG
jgi:uncharacterized membrane protein YdjX (TVP38/TMEM64 family)